MSDDIVDLSEFHLTHPPGKPYAVFDPQKDGEFEKLEKLLDVNGVEKLCRQEGVAILEKDQDFDPAVYQHWHRIYAVDLVGAQGRSLRLEGDATIHVLFQIYLKDEHYSKMWIAFLCPPGSVEQLVADQELYAERCYKTLETAHGSMYRHDN
jgi:hypothetical protein